MTGDDTTILLGNAKMRLDEAKVATDDSTLGDTLPRDARILIEIADRPQSEHVPPTLPTMFGRIVDHVTALA